MNTEAGTVMEKPLGGFARLALFGGAGTTIVLSYVFSTVSCLLLIVLIGCEFLLLLALARIGLARIMAPVLGAHIPLLMVFLRSFWLRKGVDLRVALRPAEAPALFDVLQALCQKAQVKMPREISIEMTTNAWVRLKGYRRGAGRTILGMGYDLLAGLSQWEMDGVLAHEISHAKLVQRGYKNWLNRGLGRMGQLARGLYAHFDAFEKANRFSAPAEQLFRVVDALTRLAARLVAACSRQDEFDADRGAAELCGAGAIRSSLLKLQALGECSARLPWNERVARLQTGEGFSRWLVGELSSAAPADEPKENRKSLFFKYSTHPSLADRLAALPPDTIKPQPASTPAIGWLKDPDKVAEKLMAEIQRVAAEEELKDGKRLRRWTRKSAVHANLRPLQTLGVLLVLVGGLGGLFVSLSLGMSPGLAYFILGSISLGILGVRFGRYRERLALPVPEFGALKSAWQNRPKVSEEQVRKLESELEGRAPKFSSKGAKELEFASVSYDALGKCDYVRAHIAARLCLRANKKSVEGVAGLTVAAAALGQVQQVQQALMFLQRVTGMTAPSLTWAAGWALALCGDWIHAEAFLERTCQQGGSHPTTALLLALCRANRGKLQSALLLARDVCTPSPANCEHAKFLVDLLLRAGYFREAQQHLLPLESQADGDVEVVMLMVRLNLLLRNFGAADEWTARLKKQHPGADSFVRLGRVYEIARQVEKAAAFYQQALAGGFYPEGLMGLARLEAQARNREQARKYLIEALNTERELGEKALGPVPLLNVILSQLLALEDPVPDCRGWRATLNGGHAPPGLANKQILIYAPSRERAEQSLQDLFHAMQPGIPPIPMSSIGWVEVRKEQQPDGPARAGVQGIVN